MPYTKEANDMHTTKTLTAEEMAAEIAKITGEVAPEPDTFCPECGIASRGLCEQCRALRQESWDLNHKYPFYVR